MRVQSLRDLHLFFPDIDGYWNPQNLVQTEQRIRAELPLGEKTVDTCQIEAVIQAVRLFCLQNKMTQAREFLGCADQYLKDLRSEEDQKLRVRFYLEEGRYYSLSMNPTKALESFRNAWNLSGKIKNVDHLAIDTAFMISIILPSKQGTNWFKTALELAEKSENNSLASKWRFYLYMHAGWQAFDSRDFTGSINHFEKAQNCCDKENRFLIRTVRWSDAKVRRVSGQLDKALAIQHEILCDMTNAVDSEGFVYLEIAECHQAMHEFEKASEHYDMAYKKLKENKWFSENFNNELAEILKKSKKKKYH